MSKKFYFGRLCRCIAFDDKTGFRKTEFVGDFVINKTTIGYEKKNYEIVCPKALFVKINDNKYYCIEDKCIYSDIPTYNGGYYVDNLEICYNVDLRYYLDDASFIIRRRVKRARKF